VNCGIGIFERRPAFFRPALQQDLARLLTIVDDKPFDVIGSRCSMSAFHPLRTFVLLLLFMGVDGRPRIERETSGITGALPLLSYATAH